MLPSPAHSCVSVLGSGVYCSMTFLDSPTECFAAWGCSEQEKSRRVSCWEDAGYKRNVFPGWGLSCEQLRLSLNTEEVMFPSWKCHCCRLELCLSCHEFPTYTWKRSGKVWNLCPALLQIRASKAAASRKLMFESFLRPWLSELETPLCPVPTWGWCSPSPSDQCQVSLVSPDDHSPWQGASQMCRSWSFPLCLF